MKQEPIRHDPEILRRIAKGHYNIELVLRHNQRMERALKQIIKRLESGYPDDQKIKSIEKILKTVKDYI